MGRQPRTLLCLGVGCLALAAVVVACSSSPLSRRLATPKVMRQFAQTVRPPSSETTRLLNNASILRNLGRSHLAVKELEEALERDPGNLKVVDALAQCYEDLGDYARAQALYEAALAQQPRHTALRNNLGFSYYQSGQWQKAESCFREALKLDPGNRQARNNLGLLLVRQGRQAEALALWQEREGEQVARELLNQALAAVGEKAPMQTARRPEAHPAPPALPPAPPPAASPPPAPAASAPSAAAGLPSQPQPGVTASRPPEVTTPPAPVPLGKAQGNEGSPPAPPQAKEAGLQAPPATPVPGAVAEADKPASPVPAGGSAKTAAIPAPPVTSGSSAKDAAPSVSATASRPPDPAPAAARPQAPPQAVAPAAPVMAAKAASPPAQMRAATPGAPSGGKGRPEGAGAAVRKDPPAPAPAAKRPQPLMAGTRSPKRTTPAAAPSKSRPPAPAAAPAVKEAPPSSQELLEHRLVLLNGNGRQGIARKHRQWLEMEGFSVAEVGNYRDFGQERTSINYLAGARRVARLLARTCYPQADLKEAASLPRGAAVLVILGRNQLAREAKVDKRLMKLRAMATELATRAPAAAPESSGTQSPAASPRPAAEMTASPAPLTPVTLTAAELISTRISLRNGNGTKDIARTYRTLLSRQGFTVTDIGNHIDFGMVRTTILYRPEAARVARTLAARFFPQARLEEAPLTDGLEVKVVLGKDLAGPSPDLLAQLGP